MQIRFQGIYELPPAMSKEAATARLDEKKVSYKNPIYHVMTGGVGLLLLDDKAGLDSTQFLPRLEKAKSWQKLHFEPKGLFGHLYNAVVGLIFNPIGKLQAVEKDLKASKKPFDSLLQG